MKRYVKDLSGNGPVVLGPMVLLLVSGLVSHQALAFDVGNPWFPEPEAQVLRIENLFEDFNRDVRFSSDAGVVSTSSLGTVGTVAGFSGKDTEEAHLVMLRFTYFPVGPIALQFDLGTVGQSNTGEQIVIIGGAGRMLMFNEENFQIATQFGAHFIPDYDNRYSGVSTASGPYDVESEYGSYEISWSLLASSQFHCENGTILTAYAGPRLSAYQGSFSDRAYYSDSDATLLFKGDVKQRSVFGAVVGGVCEFSPHFSIRTEARFIRESSLTGALTWSY